jgi:hypothetical protein
MHLSTVTWRKTVAAVAATVIGLLGVVVVVRSEGLPAVDAASARATRWFVHQPTGRIVLVDGYGGRALASIAAGGAGEQIEVVEGRPGAYVLNDTTAEAQAVDSAELRLGAPLGLATLGAGRALAAVGQAGLVVVNAPESAATVVTDDGETVGFSVDAGDATVIAPDGAVWSLVRGDLRRTTSSATATVSVGAAPNALLSMVGTQPFVVDGVNRRARLGTGAWSALPTGADPSEIVVQQPGPSAPCGWVAAGDELWCISAAGVDERVNIDGLAVGGSDVLAIAGDAAAVVRRGPSSIVRFDWRRQQILGDLPASVAPDASLEVTSTVDLVWVDDRAGDFVWAVNPWAIQAVDKNDQSILVLGDDGELVEQGDPARPPAPGTGDSVGSEAEIREPDDNGIDDPPVAVDDWVTARTGPPVTVPVTANDYDPDGEAIAVSAVGIPGHGSADIGTATTVVYTPDAGYVGSDQFEYTIVDGNGTQASATVFIELLAFDATNKPPIGVSDQVETGAGVPVVVEVLLNDIDPERDGLRIGGFSPPEPVGEIPLGEVTETLGPSGLPALRFAPVEGFEGTAIFSYRPEDVLGAVGQDVEIRVEVASAGDANRPPVTSPDAIRVRRDVVSALPVLVNDTDPDGDPLVLSVIGPLPPGLDVEVEGEQLSITARAGAASLLPFEYSVDDGHGHQVRGAVLVDVIDDVEPNRPPIVTIDTERVVAGETVVIDVTANDIDPDGDPLTVIDVSQPADERGRAVVFSRTQVQFTPAALAEDTEQVTARFTYTVSDGNGHQAVGDVAVTVLPEALAAPPFARDDSTFTFVDVPVTIDVLRNDGDPSGGRPALVGTPGCPSGGSAVVTADRQVRFDPPRGLSGAFRCTYEVTNVQGLKASASIIVTVREPQITNRPPEAVNDSLSVEVGATASIDVTANDRDPDGDSRSLQVVSSTAPSLGSAVRRGNVIVFTAGSVTGPTTINYQVADAAGGISLGRLLVRVVDKENVAPIAVDDLLSIYGPGVPQQFSVLSNDSDPDATPGGLAVVSATRVSGSASVSLSGSTVTVTPDPDFVGEVVANYTIRDGGGLTASARIVLTVQKPLNRPPDARDDLNEVANGGTVTTAVLFNDTDPDGDPLSLRIVGAPDPALGSATLNADRTITFFANPGASGTASITYQVSDGTLIDTAVLRITVRPCSESAPVANDGFLRTGYQQPIAIDLNAYAANGVIVDVVGPPGFANGVYAPPAGENGNVVVSYAVVNSCRLRATGNITIDVNQSPVVTPKTIEMGRGEGREIPVSELATDAEPLSIVAGGAAPEWVTTEPGRLVAAPGAGVATGSYSWSVTVRDPGGLTGVVAVTVVVVNRIPIAAADTVDVSSGSPGSFDIVDNDVDPDGPDSALRIRSVPATITFTNGASGTVMLTGSGRRIVVDPGAGLGTASFVYTVEDLEGGVSRPATVTVVGPRLNTAPFARDQAVAVAAGETRTFVLDAGDADGDPVTVVDLSDAAGVIIERVALSVTIRVAQAGSYSFSYRVTDGRAESRVATVVIDVTAPPDPPGDGT